MDDAVERLAAVRTDIATAAADCERPADDVTLVAVSKTMAAEIIQPVLAAGQRVFGENRVQEAKAKWPGLKADYPGVELHLIGPLQSNKVKEAVGLFDVIETVDRESLVAELVKELPKEMARSGRIPSFSSKSIRATSHKRPVCRRKTPTPSSNPAKTAVSSLKGSCASPRPMSRHHRILP